MPCVKCAGGDVQCGEDAGDLCPGSGGWTKAGALCLEFRTRITNGKVVLKIDIVPLDKCGGDVIIIDGPDSPLAKARSTIKPKKVKKKK